MTLIVAGKTHQLEHLLDALAALLFGHLGDLKTELDILVHIQVREQGIPLEHGIDLALVRGQIIDADTTKKNITLLGLDKSANDPQSGGFAAPRRSKKGNEFLVHDVEVDPLENRLVIKINQNSTQADQSIIVHFNILLLR